MTKTDLIAQVAATKDVAREMYEIIAEGEQA